MLLDCGADINAVVSKTSTYLVISHCKSCHSQLLAYTVYEMPPWYQYCYLKGSGSVYM